jgi:hypothetical protein
MATMTPAALLVGFCATMTAIAIGRLVVDDERSPTDVGSTVIVFGITVLSTMWVGIREPWLSRPGLALLALVGLAAIGAGVGLVARHWDTDAGAADPPRSERTEGEQTDGERNRA